MGWYWGSGLGWGGWIGMGLMMLVFWGLLVAGVVWLVRSTGAARRPDDNAAAPDPLRLLDERLARGEIDEEDYRHRRDLLARR